MLKINKNNFDQWKLLLKVLSEEIPETDPEFLSWLENGPENKELYRSLTEKNGKDSLFDKDKVYGRISDKLSLHTRDKDRFYRMKWFTYAASVAAAAVIGISGFYLSVQHSDTPESVEENIHSPGSKKAYLLSQEGEVIDLSESFEVKKDNGTVISNNNEGMVSFRETTAKKAEKQTLYVPKGDEYELLLSDGSRVHLNSETELTFSSPFGGNTREVTLSGEAYFQIEKDARPFIIHTSDLTIEVLGTTFNVNAYKTNPSINTTLVEGSLQVRLPDNPEAILLKPENNLSLNKATHEVSVRQVDTGIYTAWIKGEFVFRNQPLKDIFAQLERWYDFTVIYENREIEEMRFTGSAGKTKPLNYLLNQIQSVTDIKYKKEGDKFFLYR